LGRLQLTTVTAASGHDASVRRFGSLVELSEGQLKMSTFLTYGSSVTGYGLNRTVFTSKTLGHSVSSQSWQYIVIAVPSWRALLRHWVDRAFSRACAKTGKRMAARMAIIAITTRSSISVNPDPLVRGITCLLSRVCSRS